MGNVFKKAGEFARKNKLIVTVVVLVVAGAFYFGFRSEKKAADNSGAAETAVVQRGSIEVSVTGSGQVFANGQVDIRPQIAGDGLDVVEVAVKNDQEVKKNDLIAVLDTKDARKAIRDAELNLRSSQLKMKQTEKQYDTLTVEDKWARQLQEITVQENLNKLADAREDIEDYYIKAPFDGIVTGLSVEAGDSIARDEILASVITKEMYAEVSLNEVDAVKVKTGGKAVLTFDALDKVSLGGTVRKIDTIGTVEQGVVYFKAEISIDGQNELLKPGMNVSAKIIADSKQSALTVPIAAIKNDGNADYVQVVSGQGTENVSRKTVETGITDGIVIEIVSGLNEKDRVITKTASSTSSSQESQNENKSLFNFPGTGGGGMRR